MAFISSLPLQTSYDGTLMWKISEIRRRREDARAGTITSIYSQPFYTGRHGYKMCARLYFNGDGMGRGTHLSLYFVVMQGEYDHILRWPFKQKVGAVWYMSGSAGEMFDCATEF